MKHLWFRRKTYGWGWTPATWQGWAVLAVYALCVTVLIKRSLALPHNPHEVPLGFVLPMLILTALLILVAWYTGESPRWQWGDAPQDHS